jgi:hypothetical protein
VLCLLKKKIVFHIFCIMSLYTLRHLLNDCSIRKTRTKASADKKREILEGVWRALNDWIESRYSIGKVLHCILFYKYHNLCFYYYMSIIISGSTHCNFCFHYLGNSNKFTKSTSFTTCIYSIRYFYSYIWFTTKKNTCFTRLGLIRRYQFH